MDDLADLSDEALVKQIVAHSYQNENSFAELVRRCQGRVYSTCLRIMGNPQDAEDMAQEALFRAYRKMALFEGRSAFSTWLYRLTVNVCLNELKKQRRIPQPEKIALEEMTGMRDSPSLNGSHGVDIIQEDLGQALRDLPEPQQLILQMRDLEERSYEDIARQNGISLSAAKMRILRARVALRSALLSSRQEQAMR